MKISEIISIYSKKLTGISLTPRLDVEVLISHILNFDDKTKLILSHDKEMSDNDFLEFEKMLNRRLKSVPVAYIINNKEFMGHDFYVDENVLIPRPDTEIVVEDVINTIFNKYNNTEKLNIMDMCIGSGAILLSIARSMLEYSSDFFHQCKFVGVDISKGALEVSSINRERILGSISSYDNIQLLESNLFKSPEFDNMHDMFDIIVSNPPYIPEADIQTLSPDVKNYEPSLALSGGNDGMNFYKEIILESSKYLKNNGLLFFESGHDQADEIKSFMKNNGFVDIYFKKDLQGFNRLVCGKLRK
ncbi:peptide chain release factor N(5)-glutamine methyltransferase [Peptostreptococcus sp. D1]|uniref:peptide chain release factor N(5)-glutamine methyltransferase n=1 Tax=Peptostreptococcus sp. D1 TaxID=72304 RepID=UPI0008ED0420|nr:peptide chain release factor N(5)-glutamine methyltransferase [Peptostreptococcus sp. D1]SFE24440.1 release factor glutamine methyltransferase [Peptostreptococcus sp. D1]